MMNGGIQKKVSIPKLGQGFDIVIAPADANNKIKEQADFVCSGHQDELIINQAYQLLKFKNQGYESTTFTRNFKGISEDCGIGKILLLDGSYFGANAIKPVHGVELQGQSKENTLLFLDDVDHRTTNDFYVFESGGSPIDAENSPVIRNLTIVRLDQSSSEPSNCLGVVKMDGNWLMNLYNVKAERFTSPIEITNNAYSTSRKHGPIIQDVRLTCKGGTAGNNALNIHDTSKGAIIRNLIVEECNTGIIAPTSASQVDVDGFGIGPNVGTPWNVVRGKTKIRNIFAVGHAGKTYNEGEMSHIGGTQIVDHGLLTTPNWDNIILIPDNTNIILQVVGTTPTQMHIDLGGGPDCSFKWFAKLEV
jgi:hypothetical protein